MTNPIETFRQSLTRRQLFGRSSAGIGAAALASLLQDESRADEVPGAGNYSHFTARAKRIIYLFMHGGPSQLDLFDGKPGLKSLHGSELPDSVRQGQRLTGMTSGQKSFPVVSSPVEFLHHVDAGTPIS